MKSEKKRNVERDKARDNTRDHGRDLGRDISRDYTRDPSHDLKRDKARDDTRDLERDTTRDDTRDLERDTTRDGTRDLERDTIRDGTRDPSHDLERDKTREIRYRYMYENVPIGMYRMKLDGSSTLAANPMLVEITGYSLEELLSGQSAIHWAEPEQGNDFRRVLMRDNLIKNFEAKVISKSGEIRTFLLSAKLYSEYGYIEGTAVDITERKRLEEELRHNNSELEHRVEERTKALTEALDKITKQEKLAALGKLAGTVSHELRNPLGVITNSVYFLTLKVEETDEKIKKHLKIIQEETMKATKIISELLDFARLKSEESILVDIHGLLKKTLEQIQTPENIKVQIRFESKMPFILLNPRKMQ